MKGEIIIMQKLLEWISEETRIDTVNHHGNTVKFVEIEEE